MRPKPFQSNPEISAAVERLMEWAESAERGKIYPWELFDGLARKERYSGRWHTIMDRFRKTLLKTKRTATRAKAGVGLILLKPTEQVYRCATDRRRKAARQCWRASKEVSAVHPGALGVSERAFRQRQIDSLRGERSALRKGLRQLVLYKRRDALPDKP